MFKYELLRNQWVFLALFGGLAVLFYVVIYYFDLSKPRKMKEDGKTPETKYLSAWEGVPASLKVLIVLLGIFGIAYSIIRVLEPKSW